MGDLEHNIEVNLRGDLARRARSNERDMKRFSKESSAALKRLQRQARATGRSFAGLGKNLLTGAGIGGAISAAFVSKDIFQAAERLERLGTKVGKTTGEMKALKNELVDIAGAPDINISPEKLLDAISQIVEKTGDIEFAVDNARNMALAIQATGAEGGAVGAVTAEFRKFGIVLEKDVLAALDLLKVQGDKGAFTFENLASLGERVFSAYAATGRSGEEAVREMGAVLQVARSGTGSAEQAVTAFEALIRTFGDFNKVKEIAKRSGVQLFDLEELEKGREILRPVPDLMREIVIAAAGKKTNLSQVLDAEAMRALNPLITEYTNTGRIEAFEPFLSVRASGASLTADSSRNAKIENQIFSQIFGLYEKTIENIFSSEFGKRFLENSREDLRDLEALTRESPFSGLLKFISTPFSNLERDENGNVLTDIAKSSVQAPVNQRPINGTLDINITTDRGLDAQVKGARLSGGGIGMRVNTGPNPVGSD